MKFSIILLLIFAQVNIPVTGFSQAGLGVSKKGYDTTRAFHDGLAAVSKNHLWGFINSEGRVVIGLQYEKVSDFVEEEAVVYKSGWKTINKSGDVLRNETPFYARRFFKDAVNQPVSQLPTFNQRAQPQVAVPSVAAEACPPNIDFESGDFSNWYCYTGLATTLAGLNTITYFNNSPATNIPFPGRHTIITAATAGVDPYGGFSTNAPNGSGYSVQLGNDMIYDSAEKIRYVIQIPATSPDFSLEFQYAVVLQNPRATSVAHTAEQRPRMIAQVIDAATGNVLNCSDFLYVAASNISGFYNSALDSNVKCKAWTPVFVNLSGYAGRTIYLEFITADCTLGSHFGYAYIDVLCSQLVNIQTSCDASHSAILTAPPGYQTYNWFNSDFTAPLGHSQVLNLNPGPVTNTVYWVEVIPESGFGCTDTIKAEVIPHAPIANAGPDKNICAPANVAIGTAPVAGYTYQWSPATNLSNPSIANPVTTTPVSTSYYLTVSDGNCIGRDTVNVNVYPKPVPSFNISNPSQCLDNNSFTFTNTSLSLSALSFSWNFGDGNTSTNVSPVHVYTTPGTYNVILIVTNGNNCTDSIVQQVTVSPRPQVSFSMNNNSQCFNNNNVVVFNNNSTGAGTLIYMWSFGDGNTSSQVNPTHTYTTTGIFPVHLLVTTPGGCSDSSTNTVTISQAPVAAFTANSGSPCFGNSYTFTNTSTTGATYLWQFGDGDTSSQFSPSHAYLQPGTYQVHLFVSLNNCVDSIIHTVTVNNAPSISFTVNNNSQCLAGNNVVFTNNTTAGSGTVNYLWNFGDGNTSASVSPSHSYTAPGVYTITLFVTTGSGCTDSTSSVVTIHAAPTASFTVTPVNQCFSTSYTFTNSSTTGVNFLWQFGDGDTSSQYNPSHTYSSPGTYQVHLFVSSNNCIDSATHTIIVNSAPAISFSVNNNSLCLPGNNVVFTNNTTAGSGTVNYLWNFGDGSTSATVSPSHSYTAPGVYTVTLFVSSGSGCTDSTSSVVTIHSVPTAAFSINQTSQCFGTYYTFTNTSTPGVNYFWQFGDGDTSSQYIPSHTYNLPGTYQVHLYVSVNGCIDSVTHAVTINSAPALSFAVNNNQQCFRNNNFVFTNNTTISSGPVNYLWTFGDGGTSTVVNPVHSYTSPGTYIVHLMVSNSAGCTDSIATSVSVSPSPQAAFSINQSSQCFGTSYIFNNSSTTGANYLWKFGDGNTSTQYSPTHMYSLPGTYQVKLFVSINYCTDSITHTVVVNSEPSISFSVNNTSQCFTGNHFVFTNHSTIGAGTLNYLWNFGDGNTSSLASPSHNYNIPGTYQVKLIVTSGAGCTDSITSTVVVNSVPVASFNVIPSACEGSRFTFSNTSGAGYNYLWKFGDGQTSTDFNPSHVYVGAGNFIIQLKVISTAGCRDSVNHSVLVNPKPVVIFNANSDSQCLRTNHVVFTNSSYINTGALHYSWTFGDGNISDAVSPVHTYTNAGNYMVQLAATSGSGCKDSLRRPVIIHAEPVIHVYADPGDVVCEGSPVHLSANGALNYVWTPATGLSCTNCYNPVLVPSNNTVYTVHATDNFNCSDTASISLTVMHPFNIHAVSDTVCRGDSATLFVSGAISYAWSPVTGLSNHHAPNPHASPAATTTYTVVGSDGVCFSDTAIAVVAVGQPLSVDIGNDLSIPTGSEHHFQPVVHNGPVTSWLWSPSTGLNCNTCPDPIATITKEIKYTVVAEDIYHCRATNYITIRTFCDNAQVFIPNAFSPDGDGVNDVLYVRGKGIEIVKYFRIFNRWGEMVFEKRDFLPNEKNFGWDGKVRGVPAKPDVFVYTAVVVCGNGTPFTLKGNVSVIK